ncbi:MAG: hypothetical protein WEB06_08890 [Actinomycetota bacterium]
MNDSAASRLTPSRVVAIAVLASVPAKMLSQRLADPDLWWHIRTGRLILATDAIPHADPYSYSVPGKAWVVQEWGSEVILHALRDLFGLWGIFFWSAVMLTAVYVLVARLIHRRMGEGMGTWALFGLVAYAGGANWTERPNLFSFLLFVVLLGLLDRHDRSIWWFVPMAAVWANLHGMVILGVGTVAVVCVAEALKAATRWEGADRDWAKRLGLVALASSVATFANPRGPELIAHAFRLVRDVSQLVTEWASPDFHEITTILWMVLLLITVAALAMHPTRPDPTDLALALSFTVLGLQAARNLAVSAIVLGMVAARYLPGALDAMRPERPPRPASQASPLVGAVALVVTLGALVMVVAADFPRSDRPQDIVDAEEYPFDSLEALNRPGVRVFAYDFWAGYLIDTAWPDVRVYHDTRVDMYGREQTLRYARTIAGLPGWEESLEQSCTTHVLIRPTSDPLSELLRRSDDWRVEREEEMAVTFVRNAPASGCERFPLPRS